MVTEPVVCGGERKLGDDEVRAVFGNLRCHYISSVPESLQAPASNQGARSAHPAIVHTLATSDLARTRLGLCAIDGCHNVHERSGLS